MAITFVGAGTYTEKASLAPISVPYPAGLSANDVLVLLLGGNSATVIAAQTGYTTDKTNASTTDTLVPDLYIGHKFATGSESGTFSATSGAGAGFGQILAFRGVDLVTPIDTTPGFGDKTNTTTAALPIASAMTTTTPGVALVYAAVQNAATGLMTEPSVPAAFTETGDRVAQRNASTGYLIWSGSGSTGIITVTGNGTTRGLVTVIALRPAAAAVTRTRRMGAWR